MKSLKLKQSNCLRRNLKNLTLEVSTFYQRDLIILSIKMADVFWIMSRVASVFLRQDFLFNLIHWLTCIG